MILYLKPDRVFPNVIPAYDDASAAQVCYYFPYISFNISHHTRDLSSSFYRLKTFLFDQAWTEMDGWMDR